MKIIANKGLVYAIFNLETQYFNSSPEPQSFNITRIALIKLSLREVYNYDLDLRL